MKTFLYYYFNNTSHKSLWLFQKYYWFFVGICTCTVSLICLSFVSKVSRKLDLVYGGGSVGLMGLVSKEVHRGGGHVLGYPHDITINCVFRCYGHFDNNILINVLIACFFFMHRIIPRTLMSKEVCGNYPLDQYFYESVCDGQYIVVIYIYM